MASSVSLRKTLRRIPEFRSLSTRELDALLHQMVLKQYPAGQVLWRTENRQDFWGVIQEGEIGLEYRNHGLVTHRTRLAAGDYVDSSKWNLRRNRTSIARALSDSRIYILRRSQPVAFSRRGNRLAIGQYMPSAFQILWSALVLLLILAFGWPDLTRIVSGSAFIAMRWGWGSPPASAENMLLLDLAGFVDPGASFAFNQQGYLRFQQGELSKAAEFFATAITTDPASGAPLNNEAITYLSAGDIQKAVQFQNLAVDKNPDNATVHYNLGIMQLMLGQDGEAMLQFREAGHIQTDWAPPFQQQAFLHLKQQAYEQAEKAALTAIRLDPGQYASYVILGIALYEQARDLEALEALDTALRLSPEEEVPDFYRALVLSRQGNREEALVVLSHLLRSAGDLSDQNRITAEIEFLERFHQKSSTLDPMSGGP